MRAPSTALMDKIEGFASSLVTDDPEFREINLHIERDLRGSNPRLNLTIRLGAAKVTKQMKR